MMAFPGQVLMEYNLGDRPGLGGSVDEKQLTFVEAMTEGAPAGGTG